VIKKNLMKYYISIDLILNKLKTPEFYQEEDFRVVIWRAESKKSVPECARGVPEVCQDVLEELITLIRLQPSISREDLSKKLGISVRQVRKHIDFLRKKGILTREGGDFGQWIINNNIV
jgi:predicted HTH transcriptional regulator